MPIGSAINSPGTIGEAISRRPKEPTENFRFIVNRHDKVLEYQFGLARWIMASLLVVNGGALLALLNSADKFGGVGSIALPFVVGVVAALISGMLAWINCNLITMASDYRLDFDRLDRKSSEIAEKLDRWALGLGCGAVIFAFVSLAAFPWGAEQVRRNLAPSKSAQTAPVFTDDQMRILEKAGIAHPLPTLPPR